MFLTGNCMVCFATGIWTETIPLKEAYRKCTHFDHFNPKKINPLKTHRKQAQTEELVMGFNWSKKF